VVKPIEVSLAGAEAAQIEERESNGGLHERRLGILTPRSKPNQDSRSIPSYPRPDDSANNDKRQFEESREEREHEDQDVTTIRKPS